MASARDESLHVLLKKSKVIGLGSSADPCPRCIAIFTDVTEDSAVHSRAIDRAAFRTFLGHAIDWC